MDTKQSIANLACQFPNAHFPARLRLVVGVYKRLLNFLVPPSPDRQKPMLTRSHLTCRHSDATSISARFSLHVRVRVRRLTAALTTLAAVGAGLAALFGNAATAEGSQTRKRQQLARAHISS